MLALSRSVESPFAATGFAADSWMRSARSLDFGSHRFRNYAISDHSGYLEHVHGKGRGRLDDQGTRLYLGEH